MKKLALTLAALLLLTACGNAPTPTTQRPTASATVTPTGTATSETVEPTPEPTATQPQPTPTPDPDNLAPPPTDDDLYLQAVAAMTGDEWDAECRRLEDEGYNEENLLFCAVNYKVWDADYSPRDAEQMSDYRPLHLNRTYHVDLDGDGVDETVHAATRYCFDGGKEYNTQGWQKIYLTINGKCEQVLKTTGCAFSLNTYNVVDLDTSDALKELVFETGDFSPYDSINRLHFFSYDGGQLNYVNADCNKSIAEKFDYINKDWIEGSLPQIDIPGNGTLSMALELYRVAANTYQVNYKLNDKHRFVDEGGLYTITRELYAPHECLQPLVAYTQRDLSSKTTTITPTTTFNMLRSDLDKWIELQLPSGNKFWLYIGDGGARQASDDWAELFTGTEGWPGNW